MQEKAWDWRKPARAAKLVAGACNRVEDSMPIRFLLVLVSSLVLFAVDAFADPKDDIAAATTKLAEAFGQNDPDKVLALYATDAVLWGTTSPKVRADRAAVRDYFVGVFKAVPGVKLSFGQQLIRIYGTTAINTGSYTFSYAKDGETKMIPARYSLMFVQVGQDWMIVDHHSSAMPAAPK